MCANEAPDLFDFQREAEREAADHLVEIFTESPDPIGVRLENFPKYVRRQNLSRFLCLYELFKKIVNVEGSVIDCGVYHGGSLMTWAKLSSILEPVNWKRVVYGFDTFAGFPDIGSEDKGSTTSKISVGDYNASANFHELIDLCNVFDKNRFLGHISKINLIKGDAIETIPSFLEDNPHVVVSLLFMDFDLFTPTCTALKHFIPRMPKGAVLAFDELNHPLWPGETRAVLNEIGIDKMRLRRFPCDPNVSYAIIE